MIGANPTKTKKRPAMTSATLVKTGTPGMIGASPIKTRKRLGMIIASLI